MDCLAGHSCGQESIDVHYRKIMPLINTDEGRITVCLMAGARAVKRSSCLQISEAASQPLENALIHSPHNNQPFCRNPPLPLSITEGVSVPCVDCGARH